MKEQPSHDSSFDFDEWSALASADPEAFDLKRRAWIDDSIGHGVDRRRLLGLQCRIDLERVRAHTPLKACLRLSSLMWDSLHELHELTASLSDASTTEKTSSRSTAGATVLPFKKSSTAK